MVSVSERRFRRLHRQLLAGQPLGRDRQAVPGQRKGAVGGGGALVGLHCPAEMPRSELDITLQIGLERGKRGGGQARQPGQPRGTAAPSGQQLGRERIHQLEKLVGLAIDGSTGQCLSPRVVHGGAQLQPSPDIEQVAHDIQARAEVARNAAPRLGIQRPIFLALDVAEQCPRIHRPEVAGAVELGAEQADHSLGEPEGVDAVDGEGEHRDGGRGNRRLGAATPPEEGGGHHGGEHDQPGDRAPERAGKRSPGWGGGDYAGRLGAGRGVERGQELRRGGIAVGRVLGQRLLDCGFDRGRDAGPQGAQGRDRVDGVPGHHGARRRAGEGRRARQHLVRHAAEAVEITGALEPGLGAGLFGAHVRGSADRETGFRQAVASRRIDGASDPEVGHHGVAGIEHDVFRLDVAVDEAFGVGMAEGVRHFPGDQQGLVQRELARAVQPVTQRFTGDVGHDVVEAAGRLTGVEQRQDVGVSEPGGYPDFTQKSVGPERGGQLGPHDLERDQAVMAQVAGQVDRRHAATPQLTLDEIAVGQGGAEAGCQIAVSRGHAPNLASRGATGAGG